MKKFVLIFLCLSICLSLTLGLADGNWVCPSCSYSNEGLFCTNCGTAKPSDIWICPNCQAENKGNFCGNCGTPKASPENTESTISIDVTINGKNRSGKYSGETKDGKPDGKGIFTSDDSLPPVKYDGEWKNGVISGVGYLEAEDWMIHFETTQGKYDRHGPFHGSVLDGLPDGQGYFSTYNDEGTKWDYEGEWSKGQKNGQGKTCWYEEDGTVSQINEGRYINSQFAPVSLIIPDDSRIGGNFAGTHRARIQVDLMNYHPTKTVKSYVVEYFTFDGDGNQVSQTTSSTIDQLISPGMKVQSGNIYVEYKNANGVAIAITKATFTDGTYEVAEPAYLFWYGVF